MADISYTKLKIPSLKLREYGNAYFLGDYLSFPKSITRSAESKYHSGKGWITTMEVQSWFLEKEPCELPTN